MTQPQTLTIQRPDDLHIHLRDGAMMHAVTPFTARQFGRTVAMPNLKPPVSTTERAQWYHNEIMSAVPDGVPFRPLIPCYLTETLDLADFEKGQAEDIFFGAKLYPANATTNSADGVHDVNNIKPLLEILQKHNKPLLIHGEVTDADIFDREALFIERTLKPLRQDFPDLRITLEHVTTAVGINFVRENGPMTGGSITVHHLMLTRNDILDGGLKPHHYCLPVAKTAEDRQEIRAAAVSGETCFFLGTDSAPHPISNKESGRANAGIFTAMNTMALYAQVFEEENALDKLEGFASHHGPDFYGLPRNEGTLTLERVDNVVPDTLPVPALNDAVKPFRAGETLRWRVK